MPLPLAPEADPSVRERGLMERTDRRAAGERGGPLRPTVSPEQLLTLARSVGDVVLGPSLRPLEGPAPERPAERTLVASVPIDGAFEGLVALRCAVELARRLAAAMFGVPVEQARPEQVRDAL